jgi:hypothetical protein
VEVLARQEREKRRRKAFVDQQQAQKLMEDKRREELILEKLSKQSQEERKIASELLRVREQKELIRQNRIAREQSYAERRRKQFEESLEKDAEYARKNKQEYQTQLLKEKKAYKQYEEQRAKLKTEKHFVKCKRIVHDLVDLSLRCSEYKMLSDSEVPSKEFRDWKTLFVAGKNNFDAETVLDIADQRRSYWRFNGNSVADNDHRQLQNYHRISNTISKVWTQPLAC